MRKANVVFLVLVVGMIVFCGISYAAVAGFINAAQPAAAETRPDVVEGAVRDAANDNGETLASNTTLLTTDLIDKLTADTAAVVNLGNVSTAASGDIVTNLKSYAIGLGSVRLAQVAVTGNAYDFSDTTINPFLFSDTYAANETDSFNQQVDGLGRDQIAVIIAMSMEPADLEALPGIAERITAGKVIIVKATQQESAVAFRGLFEKYKEGFALRTLDKTDPAVVKALQGAV